MMIRRITPSLSAASHMLTQTIEHTIPLALEVKQTVMFIDRPANVEELESGIVLG
jgi:hypothetical protein